MLVNIYRTRLATSPFLRHSQSRRTYYVRPKSISTLNPDRIKREDFVDIAGWWGAPFLFSSDQKWSIDYRDATSSRAPFPPATQGFLYYYNPHPLPEFMGHLRFRVTPNDDPSTFNEGHDLLLPSRVPWKFPIFLTRRSNRISEVLFKQLRIDGLISGKILTQVEQIRRHSKYPALRNVVTELGQEFTFEFTPNQYFSIMRFSANGELKTGVTQIHIYSRSMYQGKMSPYAESYPYPGKVMACFELAHPDNPNLFVLRVTKILEPIVEMKRDPPAPREGELIKRFSRANRHPDQALVLDSRHQTYAALRLLIPE